MKTIIAVIFFVTYAFAQQPSGTCRNPLTSMPNLQIEKFFKGNWFVTHIMGGSNEATCRKYETRMEGGLIKLDANGDYTFQGKKKLYTTTCSSTSGVPLNPAGPFVLKCRHTHGSENIFFDLTFSVVDTDYNNYALVYRCSTYQSLGLNHGNLVLLQQDKTADGSKATSSLRRRNLNLNQFTKTTGC
uniref:Salivary lipocalin n=1 Tax=Triatoma matogrossensis TaxID=162370 RepID=E2J762_9HEMI